MDWLQPGPPCCRSLDTGSAPTTPGLHRRNHFKTGPGLSGFPAIVVFIGERPCPIELCPTVRLTQGAAHVPLWIILLFFPEFSQAMCLFKLPSAIAFSSEVDTVRAKKTRKNKNLEPRSDSVGTEKALETSPRERWANPEAQFLPETLNGTENPRFRAETEPNLGH
jgi:hypothetical protein